MADNGYIDEYLDAIRRNDPKDGIVGYWVRKAVENIYEDKKSGIWLFDTTEVDKRIAFQEKFSLQSKAPYYGKPMTFMLWQKFFWTVIYSFYDRKTGYRRFTDVLLEIARKNGKDLDINTNIPTITGDKLLKDVNVNDYVYGINGQPVKVLATTEFNNNKCYEIEFSDGEKIVCGDGHLWYVKDKNSMRRFKNKTINSPYYISETNNLNNVKTGKENNYQIPIPKPIQKPVKDLKINPYHLGLWLGDGSSDGCKLTVGKQDINEIESLIDIPYTKHNYHNCYYLSLGSDGNSNTPNEFLNGLRRYNLLNNKHIPEEYLEASIEQRFELLRGLMDSDGYVDKYGRCEFTQSVKYKQLFIDTVKLIRSLGIRCNTRNILSFSDGKIFPQISVIFYTTKNNNCFKLNRKTLRLKENLSERSYHKSIVSIKEVKSRPTKCLTVEGGLFLCGNNYTVTHNSTTLASDANYDLFVGEGGQDICCASNDDGQAKLIWTEVAGMRTRLDPKKTLTSHNLTTIRNDLKNVNITRLSSKTENKDGRNYAKVFLDESHDINEIGGGSEIAEACWRSMSTKDDPLFINCTTNGFNRDCYLDHKISYAKKVIEGEIEDDQFFGLLYEMDSEEEVWSDETAWAKANPALPYGVKKIAKLRRDVETAKHDKAMRIHLLTKDFNIPQDGTESWLLYDDYSYNTRQFDLSEFRGAFCLGFVDLSATTDLTSAKALLMKPDDNTKYILSHYWTLESKLEEINWQEHGADYKKWVRDGYMTVHSGTEIDISEVADWYFSLYKDYQIKPYIVGYDQRFSKVFTDRMEEYQLTVEMIQQGKVLSNAMRLTEADLKAKKIHYNENPVDRWCLRNCAVKMDSTGNIMPVKIQAERRIDGAVTFIGLNEVYRRYRAEFEQLIYQI